MTMGTGVICNAVGCKARINSAMLMCLPHWKKVPIYLQRQVYSELKFYRMDSQHLQYWQRCADAIEAVARKEDRPIANRFRDTANMIKAQSSRVAG